MESFAPQRLGGRLGQCWIADRGSRSSRRQGNDLFDRDAGKRPEEAIDGGAQLIVTHHPVPFRAVKRITTDSVTGQLLLRLIENQCAIYSPHTCFDSAQQGINQRLAEGLGITAPQPLEPIEGDPDALGAGRYGRLERIANDRSIPGVGQGIVERGRTARRGRRTR